MLEPDAWLTLAVLAGMFVALFREWLGPDIVMFGAVTLLWALGVIDTEEATSGFSNPQVLTIALLFIVSAAMRETGALSSLSRAMLGSQLERKRVLARLLVPTSLLSAVMNNTPIVAMFTPAVRDWALRHGRAPSKFLIPLSYAAILGGTCTLIGTSTNLVVSGLLEENGHQPFGMFELTWVGLPATAIGIVYLLTIGRKLLPERQSPEQKTGTDDRQYSVTLEVKAECPLIGQRVEQAGLRNLSGLFLVAIERAGRRISPVNPRHSIREGDRLVLFGVAETVVDLQKTQGLVPVSDAGFAEAGDEDTERHLFEVVISKNSPLCGTTLKDARFRRRYDAAVFAIHRGGERMLDKLGQIELEAGDTLLIEASPGFRRTWSNSQDFYLIAQVEQGERPRYGRSRLALLILVAMVVAMSLKVVTTLMAASVAVMLLLITGCVKPSNARASIDLRVFVLIASAFGLSAALVNSGVAHLVADGVVDFAGGVAPWVVLAIVYLIASAFTETVSNAAAAALVFPIAFSIAEKLEADPRPYAVAVAIAASLSFITPLGRPTNVIVYGPGGYKFQDFPRVGAPLFVICFIVAMIIIPLVWGWGIDV